MQQVTRVAHIDELYSAALNAAQAAGKLARLKWARPLTLTRKGFRDVVTDADVAVQAVITKAISEQFPEHGFLTEEADPGLRQDGPVIWIIDPIDGTTNFSRQQPVFCVSIAAVTSWEGRCKPIVGVIFDPMRDELFSAAAGRGSRLNDQPIRASQATDLEEWVVGLDWSHSQEKRQATLEALARFAHRVNTVRAIGSAALALAWVAAGRLDAYMNCNLKPWDVAAGSLLIEEAGGQLSDVHGSRWLWPEHSGSCVASNGRKHQSFLRHVGPAKGME